MQDLFSELYVIYISPSYCLVFSNIDEHCVLLL